MAKTEKTDRKKRYIPSELSRRYATALYDLAEEKNALSSIRQEVKALSGLLDQHDALLKTLENQSVSRLEKRAVLLAVLKEMGASALFRNFCSVVAENNRARHLPVIAKAFAALDDRKQNRLIAEVITARPLTSEQEKSLLKSLTDKTGKKVGLEIRLDEGLLAGLKVRMGSVLYDASLKTKLENLQVLLRQPGETA